MSAHALLSPSGASRWLACPPSAQLESTFASTTNAAADEGTLAHALCELYLRNHLKLIKAPLFTTELKKIKNNQYYSAEMNGHATDYVDFVMELYHGLHSPMIFIEERIDLQEFVPEGFGTGDCIMIADNILHIVDLKYGKGVQVDAHENKQMMLYALGALQKYHLLYTIDKVVMTIYQPRINNFSSFEMGAFALIEWGREVVKPTAKLAFAGQGEYKAGPHCRFCKARNQCRTLADFNMGLAKFAFEDPNKLTDADIAEILNKAPEFKIWLTNIQSYALAEAVQHDKQWPGFKLVAGRSNRKYTDEQAIIKAFKKAKIKDGFYLTAPSLVGIGALEKNLGKADVEKLIGKYIIKPEGAATLVPEWDKRPQLNSAEAAKLVFSNVDEVTDL